VGVANLTTTVNSFIGQLELASRPSTFCCASNITRGRGVSGILSSVGATPGRARSNDLADRLNDLAAPWLKIRELKN